MATPADEVIIGALSLAIAGATYVSAQRARAIDRAADKAKAEEAEGGAYSRAQAIYEVAIAQLRRQNHDQERQIARLQVQVARLERAARARGVLPPVEPSDDP